MRRPDGSIFLVVEPDPTVARDLAETLGGLEPEASVRLAAGPREALAALDDLGRVSVAFLRLPAVEMRSAEIPDRVTACGGRVVVLDVRPDEPLPPEREEWVYTGRPFGVDAVARALARLEVGRA